MLNQIFDDIDMPTQNKIIDRLKSFIRVFFVLLVMSYVTLVKSNKKETKWKEEQLEPELTQTTTKKEGNAKKDSHVKDKEN